MEVDIVTFDTTRLAALRHVGPYNKIGDAFARLGAIAGPAGLFGPGTKMLAIYHDNPESKPPAELRSDACLTVGASVELPDSLTEASLPQGRFAKTTYRGSYEGLGDAWQRFLGQWLPQSGERAAQEVPCFEVYVNSPMNTEPADLITELYTALE